MESRGSLTLLALILFVVAALTHAVAAQKAISSGTLAGGALAGVPLRFAPTSQLGELGAIDLTGLGELTIELGDFTDLRPEPELLGEYRTYQERGVVKQVTTRDDVSTWVRQSLGQLLQDFGLEVVEQGGDVVLSGQIRRLLVVEDSAYEADLGLFLTATDARGTTRYQGMISGFQRRFGRSFRSDGYTEALSDALVEAVHRLVTTENFRRSLVATASHTPAETPA